MYKLFLRIINRTETADVASMQALLIQLSKNARQLPEI